MTWRRYLLIVAGCFTAGFTGALAFLGLDLHHAHHHWRQTR